MQTTTINPAALDPTRPADDLLDPARVPPAGLAQAAGDADDDLDDEDLDDDDGAAVTLPEPPPAAPRPRAVAEHVRPKVSYWGGIRPDGTITPRTADVALAFAGPAPADSGAGARVREGAMAEAREAQDVVIYLDAVAELANCKRDLARARAELATAEACYGDVIASGAGTARQLRDAERDRGEKRAAVDEAAALVRAGERLVQARRPAAVNAVEASRWRVLGQELETWTRREEELLRQLGEAAGGVLSELVEAMQRRESAGNLAMHDASALCSNWLMSLEAERLRPAPRPATAGREAAVWVHGDSSSGDQRWRARATARAARARAAPARAGEPPGPGRRPARRAIGAPSPT